jgi:uncharacterized protein (DUF2384 family)
MRSYEKKKKEMGKTAGINLSKKIYEVLGEEGIDWFYSENVGLGNSRPYDFCRMGEFGEVEDLLGRIENGIF